MKKITILFLLLFGFVFSSAQNAKSTKEETLQLICDLYQSTYQYWDENGEGVFVESVTLEDNKLNKKYTSGISVSSELLANEPIEIKEYLTWNAFRVIYTNHPDKAIFGNISSENDALLLKRYLEDLLQITFEKK